MGEVRGGGEVMVGGRGGEGGLKKIKNQRRGRGTRWPLPREIAFLVAQLLKANRAFDLVGLRVWSVFSPLAHVGARLNIGDPQNGFRGCLMVCLHLSTNKGKSKTNSSFLEGAGWLPQNGRVFLNLVPSEMDFAPFLFRLIFPFHQNRGTLKNTDPLGCRFSLLVVFLNTKGQPPSNLWSGLVVWELSVWSWFGRYMGNPSPTTKPPGSKPQIREKLKG